MMIRRKRTPVSNSLTATLTKSPGRSSTRNAVLSAKKTRPPPGGNKNEDFSTPSTSTSTPIHNSDESSSDEDLEEFAPKRPLNCKFFVEQCITSNSKTKILTSDNTLNILKEKKLDISKLHSLLATASEGHSKEKVILRCEHESNFDKWLILLRECFNIMVYGVGSKYDILKNFVDTKLSNKNVVVIHGFFPGLTVKQLLSAITEEMMNHRGTFSSVHDHAEFINQHLEKHVYIVIHNIDGAMLSSEKPISVLCQLANSTKIHFVASVDHVNSGLIWDNFRLACFRFLWFDITNFSRYKMENAYENSFLLKQSNSLALSSLYHVFRSLTPNAQGIFLLLARKQLDQSAKEQSGLSFKELFRLCREAFLVNSDLTLRTQLTEFKDHNMVRVRKGQDGMEYLQVAVDSLTLKEFLEQQG